MRILLHQVEASQTQTQMSTGHENHIRVLIAAYDAHVKRRILFELVDPQPKQANLSIIISGTYEDNYD